MAERRLLRRARAVPGDQRADARPAAARRRRRTRKQAAFIVAADLLALTLLVPPGEFGRRHRRRQHAALRHADGRRRPACRLPGLPRRVQALDARPAGRRQRRRPRRAGLPAGAADARAAHPAREGHLQHLHRAGAAGGGRQHVRGLPRARRACKRIAQRVAQLHRDPGARACADSAATVLNASAFDTLAVETGADDRRGAASARGRRRQPAPRVRRHHVGIALDETTTRDDIDALWSLFAPAGRAAAATSAPFENGIDAADPAGAAPHAAPS